MSNTGLIIEERSRDIGDFLVGRILPFRKKRMVGPFIFIDHMGPATVRPGHYMDVGQHPHIGLSTLTYMLEGEIMHRDSIGSVQRIAPGSVNWMTAGSGVVHTERTPQDWRESGQSYAVHGYQIWVALPKHLEEMDPEFFHIPGEQLPVWSEKGLRFKLIAGKGFGLQSPVPVYSDLFMVDVQADEDATLHIDGHLSGEIGVCIVEGEITACEERIPKGNMLVSKEEDICKINLKAGTHALIFGGEPFPEKRYIYWNFVSTSQERIEEAKQDWENDEFVMVPGESGKVPLPKRRL